MAIKKIVILVLFIVLGGISVGIFSPPIVQAGKIVFKRNVIIRAFYKPQYNGSMSTTTLAYPQSLGGVDDYNNNQFYGTATSTYSVPFINCNANNNYCGTGTSTADAKDTSTGLIWSDWLLAGAAKDWFWANNCAYPNGLPNDDEVCNLNGEAACQCVKRTTSMTGCDALTGWRLPHQKELMQVYIDGSWGNLSSAGNDYWSATTRSNITQYAWYTKLNNGYTYANNKTTTRQVRCVR